jgi:hypothetical protein
MRFQDRVKVDGCHCVDMKPYPTLRMSRRPRRDWARPSIAEVQQDAREVTRRIRPDWKIDTPQMREKWERGEKKAFFPYGKSLRQVLVRMSNAVDQFE